MLSLAQLSPSLFISIVKRNPRLKIRRLLCIPLTHKQDEKEQIRSESDLEKAASGACGHFVGNTAILSKYPVIFTEEGTRRVEDGELRLDKRYLR